MITVPVELGSRSYDVLVGQGALSSLPSLVPKDAQMAALVTQAGIGVDADPGIAVKRFEIAPGEQAKAPAVVEQLCRDFAVAGLSRSDVVLAVGGGVVTDVAGFAAATYLRGVSYLNVATTLLAMVDAAIGGKTGVNLPEGKNLMGAFWQPVAVVCDTDVLQSLPQSEWASGRGEMAKYVFLGTGAGDDASAFLSLPIEEQVARCAAIKASVVSSDEREGSRRMVLNYGHTLAHALEAMALAGEAEFDLRHGEAVAVGLVFAAELARRLGRIDAERVEVHRRVVEGFDLSCEIPPGVPAASVIRYMARDKKARHDLTFVLDGPRGVEPVHGVEPDTVRETLISMGCTP